MKKLLILACALGVLASCKKNDQPLKNWVWEFEKSIALDGVNPIGIAVKGDQLFLSDGDNNRVVLIDTTGRVLAQHIDVERPMHIDYGNVTVPILRNGNAAMLQETALLVPEYGRDSIAVLSNNKREYLALNDTLDAPAAISVLGNELAIADFYNHRILYYNGSAWLSIGQEGKEPGMFYYPTDVQITEDAIYVADAYNNRGQVFDKTGKHVAVFGEDQKMNAATGIYVSADAIYLTDFEHKRVLVFNTDYSLKQVLDTGIKKPTDVLVANGKLLITDYGSGALVQYKAVEAPVRKQK